MNYRRNKHGAHLGAYTGWPPPPPKKKKKKKTEQSIFQDFSILGPKY